jgi:hypothetical protein
MFAAFLVGQWPNESRRLVRPADDRSVGVQLRDGAVVSGDGLVVSPRMGRAQASSHDSDCGLPNIPAAQANTSPPT